MHFPRAARPVKYFVFCALLFLGVSVFASSCGTTATTSKTFVPPDLQVDLSNMTWSKAFKAVEAKMAREYAFTQWKGVDWKALYDKYAPLIAKAESAKDFSAYFTALDKFTHSIPDAHVKLTGDDRGVIKAALGGGFGILAMKLDNGQVVAAKVFAGGPAESAGMKTGARIVSWGGKPVATALASTDTTFAMPNALATIEDVTYARLRCMVRSPVGADVPVTFRNQGESADKTATLKAVDDGMQVFNATFPFDMSVLTATSMVNSTTMPGNIGYVRVIAEEDPPASATGEHTSTAAVFKKTVDGLASSGAAGLIVDVRGNSGGSDPMVADFMSAFYSKKTLFEYQNMYNRASGKMEIWYINEATGQVTPGDGLYIEPAAKQFTGPVVVLTDVGTVSSGEGVAMCIKNSTNGKSMGYWGTNGSFGLAGEIVAMPQGLTVKFPFGQSLDKNKQVQLDSKDMKGGVSPDIRVPMTLENAIKWGAGDDAVLAAAVKYIDQKSGAK